jgi:hypothetical protein
VVHAFKAFLRDYRETNLPSLTRHKWPCRIPAQENNPVFPLLLPRKQAIFTRGARPATSGTINLASGLRVFAERHQPKVNAVLLDVSAAALHENEQHDNE